MNHDPSNTQNQPVEPLENPNDDGFVIGTAARDEDPNATTDWNHPDTHADGAVATPVPPNGTPEIDAVPDLDDAAAD